MSKKRIITMFVSLCLIVTLCVLGGAVFVVNDIQIVRMDNILDSNESITNEDVIEKANIKKGKSIFAISESKVVSNIESFFPTIKVKGVERVFPNKIIIKLTERVPTIVIKFKDKDEYLVLDNNMCAIDTINEKDKLEILKQNKLVVVEGFELFGVHDIRLGKQLPETYGQEVVVVQHILAGLLQKMKPEEITSVFMSGIKFFTTGNESKIVYVKTKQGVNIRVDYTTMKENKTVVYDRIMLAYDCFVNLENEEQKSSGYLVYDASSNSYYHKLKLED